MKISATLRFCEKINSWDTRRILQKFSATLRLCEKINSWDTRRILQKFSATLRLCEKINQGVPPMRLRLSGAGFPLQVLTPLRFVAGFPLQSLTHFPENL